MQFFKTPQWSQVFMFASHFSPAATDGGQSLKSLHPFVWLSLSIFVSINPSPSFSTAVSFCPSSSPSLSQHKLCRLSEGSSQLISMHPKFWGLHSASHFCLTSDPKKHGKSGQIFKIRWVFQLLVALVFFVNLWKGCGCLLKEKPNNMIITDEVIRNSPQFYWELHSDFYMANSEKERANTHQHTQSNTSTDRSTFSQLYTPCGMLRSIIKYRVAQCVRVSVCERVFNHPQSTPEAKVSLDAIFVQIESL